MFIGYVVTVLKCSDLHIVWISALLVLLYQAMLRPPTVGRVVICFHAFCIYRLTRIVKNLTSRNNVMEYL